GQLSIVPPCPASLPSSCPPPDSSTAAVSASRSPSLKMLVASSVRQPLWEPAPLHDQRAQQGPRKCLLDESQQLRSSDRKYGKTASASLGQVSRRYRHVARIVPHMLHGQSFQIQLKKRRPGAEQKLSLCRQL